MNKRSRRILKHRLGLCAFVVGVVVFNLGPILWGVFSSLKPRADIMQFPPTIVSSAVSMEHYGTIVGSGFMTSIRPSLIYAMVTVAVALLDQLPRPLGRDVRRSGGTTAGKRRGGADRADLSVHELDQPQ